MEWLTNFLQTMDGMFHGQIVDALAALLIALLSFIVPVVRRAVKSMDERTGLQIEALWEESLRKAMTSGAYIALANGDASPTSPAAINTVLAHATSSAPDAIHGLSKGQGIPVDILENLAKVALSRVAGPLAGPLVDAVADAVMKRK